MGVSTSRNSFDAIMAEVCPEPHAETVRKIGLYCIAIKALMQQEKNRK